MDRPVTSLLRPAGIAMVLAIGAVLLALVPWSWGTSLPASGTAHARQSQGAPCQPTRGILVARTVRRRLARGDEVTERFAGGAYRVTRCDFRGTMTSSMTVGPVLGSDGRRTLAPLTIIDGSRIVSMRYGDPGDPRWARRWRRLRAAIARRIMRATPGRLRRDPAFIGRRRARPRWTVFSAPIAHAAAATACDDGTHVANGPRWATGTYRWRWNSSSFGKNYDTRDGLDNAHKAWGLTYTNCGLGDVTDLVPQYDGSTSSRAGTRDGVNTADKGDIDAFGCPGAIACNASWRTDDTTYAESDTRFSDAMTWSNNGAIGAYDYRAVATHEFGHMVGLADLPNSPELTMYYRASTGSTKASTLGRGDVTGLRALYP